MLKYYPNALLFESRMYCQVSGFLKGRYIGDNIRQILEVIEYYETSKKAGLIFVADFEKAFDKVRLNFIYKSLLFF